MNSNDDETQVFIVRLWRERREIEGAAPPLRGTVEHVSSGKKGSISNLNGLLAFLQPYLADMGVSANDPTNGQGVRQWLRRRRKPSNKIAD